MKNELVDLKFETFEYHSGKKTITVTRNSGIGTQNKMAIGTPALSFPQKVPSLFRTFSQCVRNCNSFSVSMLQN